MFTEANADIIAADLDTVINQILAKTDFGSVKNLVTTNYITNDTINTVLDKLVSIIGGETVDNIITALATFTSEDENTTDLDFTLETYYNNFIDNVDYTNPSSVTIKAGAKILKAALSKEGGSWKDVGSFAGTKWITDGDIQGFARVFADLLKPLNSVLELLLIGEEKEINVLDIVKLQGGNGYDYAIIPLLEAFGFTAEQVKTSDAYKALVAGDDSQLMGYILERVATFAEKLLNAPVDTLLTILPNVAYFISNEGVYLIARNLLAPVFTIVNTVASVFGVDLAETLNVSKLLHNINIPIQLLGAKYNFTIPEIDFYKLAQEGGTATKEVATSRSLDANSFTTATDPYPYINVYGTGSEYDTMEHKTTQTFVVSDKGDTLTLVMTWLLEMFGDESNRKALVDWLADVFQLQSGAKQTVEYGINKMFDTCSTYDIPEIIIASLFEFLGVGIRIDAAFSGDLTKLQEIYKSIFAALSDNKSCAYYSIAKVMEQLTGTWNATVGSHDDYEQAVTEATVSLNWFQRFLAKIKAFFQKLFGVFK
jgi:hypothetical protein